MIKDFPQGNMTPEELKEAQDHEFSSENESVRMKLFKISQDVNNDYDTYDSAIVCAENEGEAVTIHPGGDAYEERGCFWLGVWCKQEFVKAECIGEAKVGTEKGVIVASFNAG